MADIRKSQYNPRLSIKTNAENMGIKVPTLRVWLKSHNIDRRYDSAFIKYTAIKKLQKRNLSAQKIADKTGYALMTVYKYMRMDSFDKQTEKDKLSTFDTSHNETVIKSVSYDQQEILNNILKLYVPNGAFDCDATYSKGVFFRKGKVPMPKLRFDKYPQMDGVQPLEDAEKLEDGSLNSIVVDLPFLITKRRWLRNAKVAERFNCFDNFDEAAEVNRQMIDLSYRKLKKKGILVMKTQDLYTEGKQIWMHRYIQTWAEEKGFKVIDMFILLSDSRMLFGGTNQQKVARKYHSYFFVFQR